MVLEGFESKYDIEFVGKYTGCRKVSNAVGANATILYCEDTENNTYYVKRRLQQINQELDILIFLKTLYPHQNILNYHEIIGKKYIVFTDHLENIMDFYNFTEKSIAIPLEHDLFRLMEKVTKAIKHLHSHGILHLDIKAENILIDSSFEPYIIDFGCGSFMNNQGLYHSPKIIGTPLYAPPESKINTYSTASDIYSLGCFYKFISVYYFNNKHLLFLNIINSMTQRNPKDRPSIDHIITSIQTFFRHYQMYFNTYSYFL